MISSARELVEKLQQDTSQQKPIDLMQYFRCLTFDVIGESGFGVRFGSLAGGEPKVGLTHCFGKRGFESANAWASRYRVASYDLSLSLPLGSGLLLRSSKRLTTFCTSTCPASGPYCRGDSCTPGQPLPTGAAVVHVLSPLAQTNILIDFMFLLLLCRPAATIMIAVS